MLDGAFMQETSNIIEDTFPPTFSAYNICKGRIFEEINKGTAWALGSEKIIKRRTRFWSTRIFFKWVWQLDPSRQTVSQIRQYQWLVIFKRVVSGTKCLRRATTPTVLLTFNATLSIWNFQLKLLSNRTHFSYLWTIEKVRGKPVFVNSSNAIMIKFLKQN